MFRSTLYILILVNICYAFDNEQKINPWKLVSTIMDKQPFFKDVCLSAGREASQYSHCIGNFTMDTVVPIASSSKIVAAMSFYDAVNQGKINMTDKVHDHVDWWSKDDTDTRSHISLQHLVEFQSGYTMDPMCEGDNTTTIEACVQKWYGKEKHKYFPGTKWDYNEAHLQILGVVLEKALNQPIDEILADGLKKYNMTHSYWDGNKNPVLAASLYTSGHDYEQFLIKYFNDLILTPGWRGLIESNYNVKPLVTATAKSLILQLFVGHYGFTMWYECSMAVTTIPNMTHKCMHANVHSCPGIFGYWPIIDAQKNYWLQVVVQGEAVLGCVAGEFFRLLLKPFVDLAMEFDFVTPSQIKKLYNDGTLPNIDELVEKYEYWKNDKELLEGLKHMVPSFMR